MSKSYAFSSAMSSRKPEVGDGPRGDLDPAPRLLIVDDVSDNRAVLTRRFQSRGFQIVEADNGFDALELIETGGFDLVLLDIMMPGIDGIETLGRIRARRSPSELPVIM